MDARFLRLGLRGVRITPTFTDAPSWADPGSPASARAAFSKFLAAFAARYGRGGTFWQRNRHLDESQLAVRDYEIWDRGNLSQSWWDGSASAAEYASAYAEARAAIRRVDPRARALVSLDQGGVSYASFVRQMVSAVPALRGNIDGAFVLAGTSRTVRAVESTVAAVRWELDVTRNLGAPIQVGFGQYTSGPGAMTEAQRALFYSVVVNRLARSDCGVGGVLARSWITPRGDPARPSAWYGMVDPQTFALGQTARAYADVAGRYLGYGPRAAPRAVVHTCFRPAPDSDGDGVADAAESYPLDAHRARAEAKPPPPPHLTSDPDRWTSSGAADFDYSARGAVGYWCRLDRARLSDCDPSGRSYSNLAPGRHVFRVQAVDAHGLVSPRTVHAWTIDRSPPNTVLDAHPASSVLVDSARFEFSSNEAGVRFACRVDLGRYRRCASPVVLNDLADGRHRFRVAAIDRAGNGDSTPVGFSFQVHTLPASPAIRSGPTGSTSRGRPTFRFAARYAVRYRCRFDRRRFRRCTGAHSHRPSHPLKAGRHTFKVRGIGGTGRPGPTTTRRFRVKR